MSTKNGQLLWRRARVVIPLVGGSVAFDTGIRQPNLSLGDDPSFAQRLMIIPLPPTTMDWTGVTISEPTVGPNGTLVVTFSAANLQADKTLNVLFWDPHTIAGPGQADTYNP